MRSTPSASHRRPAEVNLFVAAKAGAALSRRPATGVITVVSAIVPAHAESPGSDPWTANHKGRVLPVLRSMGAFHPAAEAILRHMAPATLATLVAPPRSFTWFVEIGP